MVFTNPSLAAGEKTFVESKGTPIRSTDDKLAMEVLKQLLGWLNLDLHEKYKFLIFVKIYFVRFPELRSYDLNLFKRLRYSSILPFVSA